MTRRRGLARFRCRECGEVVDRHGGDDDLITDRREADGRPGLDREAGSGHHHREEGPMKPKAMHCRTEPTPTSVLPRGVTPFSGRGPLLLPASARCATCDATVAAEAGHRFRDRASFLEFRLSGMCQRCQDAVFGGAS